MLHKSQPNATFLLSLDCEGRWGWSDRLTDSRREALRDGPIEAAYEGVIRTLHEQTIAATFAFVGMFALDSSSINSHWKMIADHLWKLSPYTMAALQDIDAGRLDGWSGARVFGMVRSANDPHELAAHGFTHVPWTAPYVTRSDLMKELELIQETWPARGTAPQTFVYPRNQIAEVELLERKSFAGFRLDSQQRARVSRLLTEFNLWSSPEYPHLQKRDIVEIPGGFFLNRRSGVRRLVPMQVTVTRWR